MGFYLFFYVFKYIEQTTYPFALALCPFFSDKLLQRQNKQTNNVLPPFFKCCGAFLSHHGQPQSQYVGTCFQGKAEGLQWQGPEDYEEAMYSRSVQEPSVCC